MSCSSCGKKSGTTSSSSRVHHQAPSPMRSVNKIFNFGTHPSRSSTTITGRIKPTKKR